jgi:hypothetical protein
VTLESQKRIWRLAQRLADHEEVLDAIPGMNNITVVLRHPQEMAWDAIEQLQRWWEESEALEPESRLMTIPVIYGGEDGPDLANVARHSGLTKSRWLNCTPPSSTWCGFWFPAGISLSRRTAGAFSDAATCGTASAGPRRLCRHRRRANRRVSAGDAGRMAAAGPHAAGAL